MDNNIQIDTFEENNEQAINEMENSVIKYVYDSQTDKLDEMLSTNILKNNWISVSFYGTKVFEYTSIGKRYKFPTDTLRAIGYYEPSRMNEGGWYIVSGLSDQKMHILFSHLVEKKRKIFESLTYHSFACCSSYKKCSEAKKCLHENDRQYSGCKYRKNLEAGRIFY